ncbi:hypothetical protein [Rhodococcus sp. 24CO]|uniref:hypothetical protein n=1 Tax=Rhodococcus sp. 24CO TaxID=3117460 RepID=UPI003D33C3D4
MNLDMLTCPQHGWISHAAIHEAAHAVFAHARGIPFIDISLATPADLAPLWTGGSVEGGGLQLTTSDPTVWVPQRPDDAADVLLAGVQAEEYAFGHIGRTSGDGDVKILRLGMGWVTPEHETECKGAINRSRSRLREEMPARYETIRLVATELTRDVKVDDYGAYSDFDERPRLSAEEVAAIIENH